MRKEMQLTRHPPLWQRAVWLVGLLFLFLVAIKLLESGIKVFGEGAAGNLFEGIQNPFAALAAGILATVLVQSSSVSTSTIVALVGSGAIGVEAAVPMVMGANIGTTITNTLVSLGSIRRSADFQRAFSAATVHDFFNLMAVAIFLPLQIATGFFSNAARHIAAALPVGTGPGGFQSPIKSAVKDVAGWFKHGVQDWLGLEGGFAGVALLILGLGLIFFSLTTITRTMRAIIADKAERALNAALRRSGWIAIAIGVVITISVQSSSITTSLLVPLCASGVLTLENAFPVMLGANIGTTITAFLASMATDINGLQIAIVHGLFNLVGVGLVYPIRAVRRIPIRIASSFSAVAVRNKFWVVFYVLTVFILIPLCGILIFG